MSELMRTMKLRSLKRDKSLRKSARVVHPDIPEERIFRRIDATNETFEDALIEGWEPVCAGLDLPDPDDRHVLAAAMRGGAHSLVTFNIKDFPQDLLVATGVVAVHPDEFLLDQLDLYPGVALQVLTEQSVDLKNPPSDVAGVLNRLERCGVPRFADAVRLLMPRRTVTFSLMLLLPGGHRHQVQLQRPFCVPIGRLTHRHDAARRTKARKRTRNRGTCRAGSHSRCYLRHEGTASRRAG
jgi:hypothetical protein